MSEQNRSDTRVHTIKFHLDEVEKLANLINDRTQHSGLLGSWNECEGGMRECSSVKELNGMYTHFPELKLLYTPQSTFLLS